MIKKVAFSRQKYVASEYDEACAFVDWLELQKQHGKILDYCHIANESYGGTRADMLRGAKLKRMGRKRGVFDYQIFINRELTRYQEKFSLPPEDAVICVELKKCKGGKASSEQIHWRQVYKKCGIPAEFCRGADEAIEFVKGFLE